MKEAWLAFLTTVLKDGKFGVAISATLVTLMGLVGMDMDVEQVGLVVSPLLALILGQVTLKLTSKKEEKKEEVLHD